MKQKLFSSSFLTLFVQIPLLFGFAMTFFLNSSLKAFPDSSLSATILSLAPELQAGVFPDPDEVPDGNLPQGNIESEFLPSIINILLAIISTVLLGTLLTAGTLFIIHFGNEEKITTAKGIIKWCFAGIIIIVVAYALVQGVTNLTFDRSFTET